MTMRLVFVVLVLVLCSCATLSSAFAQTDTSVASENRNYLAAVERLKPRLQCPSSVAKEVNQAIETKSLPPHLPIQDLGQWTPEREIAKLYRNMSPSFVETIRHNPQMTKSLADSLHMSHDALKRAFEEDIPTQKPPPA